MILTTPDGGRFEITKREGRKALKLHIAEALGWTNIRVEKTAYVLFVDEEWGTSPAGYEGLVPNWPENAADALRLVHGKGALTLTTEDTDVWFGELTAVIGWDKDAYENIERTFTTGEDGAPSMALALCILFLKYDAAVKALDASL